MFGFQEEYCRLSTKWRLLNWRQYLAEDNIRLNTKPLWVYSFCVSSPTLIPTNRINPLSVPKPPHSKTNWLWEFACFPYSVFSHKLLILFFFQQRSLNNYCLFVSANHCSRMINDGICAKNNYSRERQPKITFNKSRSTRRTSVFVHQKAWNQHFHKIPIGQLTSKTTKNISQLDGSLFSGRFVSSKVCAHPQIGAGMPVENSEKLGVPN